MKALKLLEEAMAPLMDSKMLQEDKLKIFEAIITASSELIKLQKTVKQLKSENNGLKKRESCRQAGMKLQQAEEGYEMLEYLRNEYNGKGSIHH